VVFLDGKTMLSTRLIDSDFPSDNLLFREASYPTGAVNPFHIHGETHLIFFLAGTVEEIHRKQTFLRTAPTLILMPADEPHATRFCEPLRTFEIELSAAWTERVRQVSPLADQLTEFRNGLPVETAIRLYREYQTFDNLTPLIMEGLLLELLVQMARGTAPGAETTCPRWLLKTRDMLHDRFTERLSLETIAAEIGVHPSHLVRAFKQHFHCTIGDYIRNLRMAQARHLLTHSEIPLSEIALAIGYSDQSHFTTAFRRQTGISPGKCRKICRGR
jgi:AraC family transcriptional regulator